MNAGAVRNGRVVLGGVVRDIMLPPAERYTFDFSRYKHIVSTPFRGDGVEKVVCHNSPRIWGMEGLSAYDREELAFWSHVVGFETGNASDEATNEYRRVSRDFDILAGGVYCFEHPALASVLEQLGISRLMPFYLPRRFGLKVTGERVPMEVDQMKSTTGRTATFEPTVLINGQPYLLEVKGVNFGDKPLELRHDYYDAGECAGGLPVARMQNSIEIKRRLNDNGYDSDILLAAYTIPGLHQFDGQPLGAYVRAVRSSPPVSHYHENLKDVADALGISRADLAEQIIRSATRDAAIIWKLGIVHGWIHEQNIRFDGLSDLTGAKMVFEVGFNGMATDAEMLVASSQKIMRRLVGPKVEYPSEELYESDPTEADRLMELAEELSYQDQAAHYCATREIITDELNRRLGLSLPAVVGTTTLAAEVYEMQRQLRLTDPKERIHIEHLIDMSDRRPLTLRDVRLVT